MADTPGPPSLEERLAKAVRAVPNKPAKDARSKRKRKRSGRFRIPAGTLRAVKAGFLTLPANADKHPFWTRPVRISTARRSVHKHESDAPVFAPPPINMDNTADAIKDNFDQFMDVLKPVMSMSIGMYAAVDTLTANMARDDSLQDVSIDRRIIDRIVRIAAINRLCEWADVDPNLIHAASQPDGRQYDMEKAVQRIEAALWDTRRKLNIS